MYQIGKLLYSIVVFADEYLRCEHVKDISY